MKLREILDDTPATTSPDEYAGTARERMRDEDVTHLVVIKDGRVVGLVSNHDLGGPAGGAHRRMGRRVADLMSPNVITASPGTSVRRASMLMRKHRIGCLPVVARGQLVGAVDVSRLLALLEKKLAGA